MDLTIKTIHQRMYKDCIQTDLRDVYHQIEQYHNCQIFNGNCDTCTTLVGGCEGCLEMNHKFVRDCCIVIDDLKDDFFSETMTMEEWKQYWIYKSFLEEN